MTEQIITLNGRFAHRWEIGADNTVCGANPSYYPSINKLLGVGQITQNSHEVRRLSSVEASRFHKCKRCWP
jgi:hypothetical protein